MLNFPKSAEFNKIMPKEVFYKNLSLSTDMKDKFVSSIKRIVWQYKLAPATINTPKGEKVGEILVLSVELKKKDIDTKILEAISKQNAHKVLYILNFEDTAALALYMGKIYTTAWQPLKDIEIEIKGLNLDKVWDSFVEQIAITEPQIEKNENINVIQQLAKQEERQRLEREIQALKNKIRNTKQFNVQVKLKQDLRKLKEKLI